MKTLKLKKKSLLVLEMDLSVSRKWPGKNFTFVEGSIMVSSSTCKHTQQGSLVDFFHKGKRLVLKWSQLTSHT